MSMSRNREKLLIVLDSVEFLIHSVNIRTEPIVHASDASFEQPQSPYTAGGCFQ